MQQPLAYRMRPRHLDEVVGQQHLVGPGKIIRRMVEAKMLSSAAWHWKNQYCQRNRWFNKLCLSHVERGHRHQKRFTNRC